MADWSQSGSMANPCGVALQHVASNRLRSSGCAHPCATSRRRRGGARDVWRFRGDGNAATPQADRTGRRSAREMAAASEPASGFGCCLRKERRTRASHDLHLHLDWRCILSARVACEMGPSRRVALVTFGRFVILLRKRALSYASRALPAQHIFASRSFSPHRRAGRARARAEMAIEFTANPQLGGRAAALALSVRRRLSRGSRRWPPEAPMLWDVRRTFSLSLALQRCSISTSVSTPAAYRGDFHRF